MIIYLCSLLIDDLPLPSIRQAPSNQSNVIAIHQDHGGHPLYNLELKHTISIPVVVDGQVLSHGVGIRTWTVFNCANSLSRISVIHKSFIIVNNIAMQFSVKEMPCTARGEEVLSQWIKLTRHAGVQLIFVMHGVWVSAGRCKSAFHVPDYIL